MKPLEEFCCLNEACADFGKRGAGNLRVHQTYGKHQPIRLLKCTTCKARFSERRNTPLEDCRMPEERAENILHHLAEGCGIRQTCRLTGASKDAVQRFQRKAGEHAQSVHEERVRNLSVQEAQLDEKWSFVGKKEAQHTDDDDPQAVGDQWDHVALAVESRLVVSMIPGRRTQVQTELLVQDFACQTNAGQPPRLITADEYKPYQAALLATYGEWVVPPRTGRPGRPRKAYQVPPADLVYAVVHKTRQNGKVIAVEARLIYGTPEALATALQASPTSWTVNTAFVEHVNGTDRHLNARKARKTYRFSKVSEMHVAQSWLSVTNYNFCWHHRGLRVRQPDGTFQHPSPAMAAKLTDRIWSIHDLAHYPVVRWCSIASTN